MHPKSVADRRTDRRTDERTDGQSEPTTRPAKATQVIIMCSFDMFKPPRGFLLTVPRRCFFFMFHVCLYYIILSVPCSLVITCWEMSGLLCFVVFLSLSHMVSLVGVVLDCIDSCSLPFSLILLCLILVAK